MSTWISTHLRKLLLLAAPLIVLSVACSGLGTVAPTPTPTAEASTSGVALTVYNQGTALVRDRRQFTLTEGLNEIAFSDVAASIDPTSVLFRSITNPKGTSVLEQNYEYDLVGTQALLEKYLDQDIRVVTKDGKEYRGRLLSGRGDIILQDAAGGVIVVKIENVQDFSFPELPEGLRTRPTLVWRLQADQTGSQDVEVTYLTGGMSWQADYVLLLSTDEKHIDLDGWITLSNGSGATFRDAHLKLVAGDLNRIQEAGYAADKIALEQAAAPTAAPVEQREFFEYHLYDVPRPVTVRDNETKQIEFVSAGDVAAAKFFVYDGAQCYSNPWYCGFYGYPQIDPSYGIASNPKVMVMVEFDTEDVDADLPKGRVRVYQQDIDEAALLIGENTIDHTPKGEQVRLYVGDAFDIVGERIQTDFRTPNDHTLEETFKITLRNHKDEAVEVRVVENLFRWSEWRILEANDDYTKVDSSTIEFRANVAADGEKTITYTVRYTWP
jgi:hypothetical protein